jgi:hypothetical protein
MTQTQLNSLQSMFNLGNTPKVNGKQMTQNVRFMNQENENAINRNRLRTSFGNFVYKLKEDIFDNVDISINDLSSNTATIKEQKNIYAYNRSILTITFDCSDSIAEDISKIKYNGKTLTNSTEFASFTSSGNTITYTDTNLIPNLGGLTPFRKAYNAGDIMNTYNKPPTNKLVNRAPNQINSMKNMFGWQSAAGSINKTSDGSFYSGNPKFVYDGSDYSKFKKLQAINKNYNDTTFGGN